MRRRERRARLELSEGDTEGLLLETYTVSRIWSENPHCEVNDQLKNERRKEERDGQAAAADGGQDTAITPMRSAELQSLLDKLREKQERVDELEMRLEQREGRASFRGRSSLSPSSWSRDISLDGEVSERHPKLRAVCRFLLSALQSKPSALRHCSIERQAAVIERMQLCSTEAERWLDIASVDSQRCLCVVEDGELTVKRSGDEHDSQTLKQGDVFVFDDLQTGQSTVWSKTACPVWWISESSLRRLQERQAKQHATEYSWLLGNIAQTLFGQTLSRAALAELVVEMDDRQYDSGEELAMKDEEGGSVLFVVQEGEVVSTDSDGESTAFSDGQIVPPLRLQLDTAVEDQLKAWTNSTRQIFVASCPTCCAVIPLCLLKKMEGRARSNSVGHHSVASQSRRWMHQGIDIAALHLSDFKVVGTIGVGAYSRVELVHVNGHPRCTFARKRMSKAHLAYKQQSHIADNEKVALQTATENRCPFIVQLFRTMQDSAYLYFLLELQQGGDLQTHLHRYHRRQMPESHVRFYAACVVEALDFLRSQKIIYRGLKPEDVLLSSNGYSKLCDFDSCKPLTQSSETTRSFCGTPEYLAPEIIKDCSHGLAVDLWTLGILIYELTCGRPPFHGEADTDIYEAILNGIDSVQAPKQMKRPMWSLVRQLCHEQPEQRLSSGEPDMTVIRQHPGFHRLSWSALRNQSLPAPFVPRLQGERDLQCFETFPPEQEQAEITSEEDAFWKDF